MMRAHTVNYVSLTFTVSEPTSWMGYSLDGQANVTITGNTTLTELSDGSHSLIVYAKDIAGNTGAPEIIYFSIKTQQSEPFPITWIVTAIAVIAVVGAAFLVYFVKVKKTTGKAEKIPEFPTWTSILVFVITYSCRSHLQTKTIQNTNPLIAIFAKC